MVRNQFNMLFMKKTVSSSPKMSHLKFITPNASLAMNGVSVALKTWAACLCQRALARAEFSQGTPDLRSPAFLCVPTCQFLLKPYVSLWCAIPSCMWKRTHAPPVRIVVHIKNWQTALHLVAAEHQQAGRRAYLNY